MRISPSFFIARRYFVAQRQQHGSPVGRSLLRLLLTLFTFSPRRIGRAYQRLVQDFIGQNFIKILSNIAMIGVGFGTAALVVVLSFFNGMEGLLTGMYNRHNPELLVLPAQGKTFVYDKTLQQRLQQIEGIGPITEVMEDNALMLYGEKQKVVRLKGVSDNFAAQTRIDTTVVLGEGRLFEGQVPFALVGAGVYQELGLRLRDYTQLLQFWYPKRGKRLSLNPDNAFNREGLQAMGVLLVEPEFDQRTVIVPLDFADYLFEQGERRSALEVRSKEGDVAALRARLQRALGSDFLVRDRAEQQADVLRALEIERLFTFATFVLIMGIASFNVFFSLAMLVIEKQRDTAVLRAMGAPNGMIARIFLYEGTLIALVGAGFGLALGWLICFMQQQFQLIRTGTVNTLMDSYPVEMRPYDFLLIGLVVVGVTLLAAWAPARKAARADWKEHL